MIRGDRGKKEGGSKIIRLACRFTRFDPSPSPSSSFPREREEKEGEEEEEENHVFGPFVVDPIQHGQFRVAQSAT